MSTKFYKGYDEDVSLSDYAEYGNMTNDHLIKIEMEFLAALNWNLYVSNEEFFRKFYSLEAILAQKQGLHRGWFTYVELNHLLPSITIAKSLIQYTLVLAMSYAAFVATIAGSIFLVSHVPGTSLYASSTTAVTTTTSTTATGTTSGTSSTRTASTQLDSNNSKTDDSTKANEIDELDADVTQQLLNMESIIEQQRQAAHWQRLRGYHNRRRECPNSTSVHSLPHEPSIWQSMQSMMLGQAINQPQAIESATTNGNNYPRVDNDDQENRIGNINLKKLLFGTKHGDGDIDDEYSAKRRNQTDTYDWLMPSDHHDITAEISSCSNNNNDFGLIVHWRKFV